MSDTDREHLVANIVGHASDDVASETQLRVVAYWSAVDPDLGDRVAAGLRINAGSPTASSRPHAGRSPHTPTAPDGSGGRHRPTRKPAGLRGPGGRVHPRRRSGAPPAQETGGPPGAYVPV